MPPNGHSPLKVKTGVRVLVGAPILKNRSADNVERFLSLIRFDHREKLNDLPDFQLDSQ